jgi:hypothetical protein
MAVIASVAEPEGPEFSAEVVDLSPAWPAHEPPGRIYAGKHKLRRESVDDDGNSVVTIYDLDRDTMLLLDPEQMAYFKFPYPIDGYGIMTSSYSHARGEPCGSGYRATRVGSEAVDGRMAEKWLCEVGKLPSHAANGSKEEPRLMFVIDPWHIWYDMEHSLMLRYVMNDGDGRELRNLRIAPQPDHLFAVPPAYRKVKSSLAAALDFATHR